MKINLQKNIYIIWNHLLIFNNISVFLCNMAHIYLKFKKYFLSKSLSIHNIEKKINFEEKQSYRTARFFSLFFLDFTKIRKIISELKPCIQFKIYIERIYIFCLLDVY